MPDNSTTDRKRAEERAAQVNLRSACMCGVGSPDYTCEPHRDIADALTTFASEVRAESWQPIETAPKDGRTILLGYTNRSGKWRTLRGQWYSDDMITMDWEDPDEGEEGWYETSVQADDPPNVWPVTPTHWMPLPTPPAIRNEVEHDKQSR